ncbi:hypothetical protein BGY98DRAFT_1035656 [Russula aff. rugulosa BPL654]|nr:hypothetical protein BGY98DRAFT_1035656 [Russula aff. rugulosa BPL654]
MVTAATTPASTPARGRGRTLSRVRVQVPRSGRQESDSESSVGGKAPAAAATPASPQRRRSDAKPRSAAPSPSATLASRQRLRSDAKPKPRSAPSSPASKVTSPPSSPNTRGRKPPSVSKMDSVEIRVSRSPSRTRSRMRGSGAETGDEKTARGTTTERNVRKRRKVAHTATA